MEKFKDNSDFKLLMHDGLNLANKYIKEHPECREGDLALYIRQVHPSMFMTPDGKCHEGPLLICDADEGVDDDDD